MKALMTNLLNDEAGFIVSAEIVMIATLGILALTVGLSEVSSNINKELQDVGRAFGSMNQSYSSWGQNGNSSYSDSNQNGQNDIQSSGNSGEQ